MTLARGEPHRSAYADFLAATRGMDGHGFPRAVPVREWVPGWSNPEGGLLMSAAVAATWFPSTPGVLDHLETAAHLIGGGALLAVTVGLPAASVWFGYSLVTS
jgi:hypothetical protein